MSKEKYKDYQQIYASAARTATSSATVLAAQSSGVFYINVTAISGAPSVVFTIEGIDPISSATYTILASAAVTAPGLTVLRVCAHLAAAANTVAKDILPQALKITATHGNANSITYSMCYVGMEV